MTINVLEMKERIRAKRAAAFYGRRYFYTTASDGHQIIGVLQGLGDNWIVGYFRECGSIRALKVKVLWSTTHAADLQNRLDIWATKLKGLTEVPQ